MATDRGLADRPSGDLPQTPTQTTWITGLAGLCACVFFGCWFAILGLGALSIVVQKSILSESLVETLVRVSFAALLLAFVLAGIGKLVVALRK